MPILVAMQDSAEEDRRAFAAFYHQHPMWRDFWERLHPQATQLLQLSTPSELASLAIHHEVFKPLSVANIATFIIDAGLIGGAKVQVGDHLLDTSVKARLDALRTQLVS